MRVVAYVVGGFGKAVYTLRKGREGENQGKRCRQQPRKSIVRA